MDSSFNTNRFNTSLEAIGLTTSVFKHASFRRQGVGPFFTGRIASYHAKQ